MEWAENFKGLQHIGIPTNDMDKTPKFFSPLLLHRQWQWVRYIPLQESALPPGFLRKPGIFHHFCAMFSPRFRPAI